MLVEDAIAALRDKYGDPSPIEPVRHGLNRWRTAAGHECNDFAHFESHMLGEWMENDVPVQLTFSMPTVPSHYRNPLLESGHTDCGPMLTAHLNFDASKAVSRGHPVRDNKDHIEQVIFDIGAYVEAFKANRVIRTQDSSLAKPVRPKL